MLKCEFHRRGEKLTGFSFSGHAGYETENGDIVCAAVSSCVMLACNAITDFFKAKAEVEVLENKITLRLDDENESAEQLINALYNHISQIAEDYPKVKVIIRGGKNDD